MQLIKSFHLTRTLMANLDDRAKVMFESMVQHSFVEPSFTSTVERQERLTGLMTDANVVFSKQVFFQPLPVTTEIKEPEKKTEKKDVVGFSPSAPGPRDVVADRHETERAEKRIFVSDEYHRGRGPVTLNYDEDVSPDQLVIAVIQVKPLDMFGRQALGWRLGHAAEDVVDQLVNNIMLTVEGKGRDACDVIIVTTYREIHLLAEVATNKENVIEHLIANHRIK